MIPIHSYPKVHSLGHPQIADLLKGEIIVEEKLDGSQFSFMVTEGDCEPHCRSRGAEIYIAKPDKMFALAVESVRDLYGAGCLPLDWIFRCEYLRSPKHHTLKYDRVPARHLAVFDIETAPNVFMPYHVKASLCDDIGLQCVPLMAKLDGSQFDLPALQKLLKRESFLGGVQVEGVVIKNYGQFGADGKILAGKLVREEFKEEHRKEWAGANPGSKDIIQRVGASLNTHARFEKAIQHLAELGQLEHSPRDIGPLIGELARDLEEEHAEHIKAQLYKHAIEKIQRIARAGFPEWYKALLAASQFSAAQELGDHDLGGEG